MKSKICCLALLIFGSFIPALGQGLKLEALGGLPISKLRSVAVLSDYELVGWSGKHEFFELSKEFLWAGTERDFKRFLSDRNPVVRAMGLLCLAQTDFDKHFLTLFSHTKDKGEVSLAHGCIISRITVGEFAKRLLANPYFLEPEGKKPAMQTTPAKPLAAGGGSASRNEPGAAEGALIRAAASTVGFLLLGPASLYKWVASLKSASDLRF